MHSVMKSFRLSMMAAALGGFFATALLILPSSAQTLTPVTADTIKAVQGALNTQGIAVKVDGILNDETRAAIRKFQAQHHVAVTGEPDKATLDKLGIRQGAALAPASALAQANPASPAGESSAMPQTPPAAAGSDGMMMNCSMMQGQMQMMMQKMHAMMETMQTQMRSGQAGQTSQMPGLK